VCVKIKIKIKFNGYRDKNAWGMSVSNIRGAHLSGVGLRLLACCDYGFGSCRGRGCLLLVLCVVRYRSLRRGDHWSRGVLPSVGVSECHHEASTIRRPWPTRGCCAMENIDWRGVILGYHWACRCVIVTVSGVCLYAHICGISGSLLDVTVDSTVLGRSEFLATDTEVPGSIPGATRFSE